MILRFRRGRTLQESLELWEVVVGSLSLCEQFAWMPFGCLGLGMFVVYALIGGSDATSSDMNFVFMCGAVMHLFEAGELRCGVLAFCL